jgi:hypothetical protein
MSPEDTPVEQIYIKGFASPNFIRDPDPRDPDWFFRTFVDAGVGIPEPSAVWLLLAGSLALLSRKFGSRLLGKEIEKRIDELAWILIRHRSW